MFALIITIVAIALVALLALATIYYGSSSFDKAGAQARGSTVLNQANQLLGASEVYLTDQARFVPSIQELVAQSYLQEVPAVPPGSVRWEQPEPVPFFWAPNALDQEACRHVNLKARGDSGIYRYARSAPPIQCFGQEDRFTVLAMRAGQDVPGIFTRAARPGLQFAEDGGGWAVEPTAPASSGGTGNGNSPQQPEGPTWSMTLLPEPTQRVNQGARYSFDAAAKLQFSEGADYPGTGAQWDVSQGALPSGLALSEVGVVSGVPQAESSEAFTLRASYKGKSAQQQYQIEVPAIELALNAAALADGTINASYSANLAANLQVRSDASFSGRGVAWSVVQGQLPAGLSLNPTTGVITGTPSAASTGSFTVQASYKEKTAQQVFNIAVAPVEIESWFDGTLSGASIGTAYSVDLKQGIWVNGDASFSGAGLTWRIKAGTALPPGLSLNTATGVISGTPSGPDAGPFILEVFYKTYHLEVPLHIKVAPLVLALNPPAMAAPYVDVPYTASLAAALSVQGDATFNGTGATWAVTRGKLPTGLAMSSAGAISGTLSARSSETFQVTASYRGSQATADVTLAGLDSIRLANGARTWSDGTLASSCNKYRLANGARTWSDGTLASSCNKYRQASAADGKGYVGATGSGNYRVSAGGLDTVVYCDMTLSADSGYTVVAVAHDYRKANGYYLQAEAGTPPTPTQAAGTYLPAAVFRALATESVEFRIQEQGTSNYIYTTYEPWLVNLRSNRPTTWSPTLVEHDQFWVKSSPNLAKFGSPCYTNSTWAYPSLLPVCGDSGPAWTRHGMELRWMYASWSFDTYSNGPMVAMLR